jgi:hypothetical protein
MRKKRLRILQEFLQTEKTYAKSLTALVESLITPLRQGGSISTGNDAQPILENVEVQQVFCNVELLQGLALQFQEQLQVAFDALTVELEKGEGACRHKISPFFIRTAPFLRMYKIYCNGYAGSCEALKKLEGRGRWVQFRDEQLQKQTSVSGATLGSLLIMPIQRIPRYVMLLRELMKNTWAGHPDFAGIANSVQLFEGIANEVNAGMHEHEASLEMMEVCVAVQ